MKYIVKNKNNVKNICFCLFKGGFCPVDMCGSHCDSRCKKY